MVYDTQTLIEMAEKTNGTKKKSIGSDEHYSNMSQSSLAANLYGCLNVVFTSYADDCLQPPSQTFEAPYAASGCNQLSQIQVNYLR